MSLPFDTAIIGAGIAGLRAAQLLQAAGRRVVVLEKSRGFGGRAASRSIGQARVDHGAPTFTARSVGFREQVADWLQGGVIITWEGGIWSTDVAADGIARPPSSEAHPRFIAPAGMNALGKSLAEGLDVRREAEVAHIEASGESWRLHFQQDLPPLNTHTLMITAPAPQALKLLPAASWHPQALAAAQRIHFAPCFALMAGFDDATERNNAPPWPALRPTADPLLQILVHDASKRPTPHPTTLVLHATAGWTRTNFDLDPEEVTRRLLEAASAYWPSASTPSWTRLHRWRYAQPEALHPASFLEAAPGVLLAGDAFADHSGAGGRIEGAYLSGEAAASHLLAST